MKYTLAQLTKKVKETTGRSRSTIKYWTTDRFEDYFFISSDGKNSYYEQQAVDVINDIHQLSVQQNPKLTETQIKEMLTQKYGIKKATDDNSDVTTALTVPTSLTDRMFQQHEKIIDEMIATSQEDRKEKEYWRTEATFWKGEYLKVKKEEPAVTDNVTTKESSVQGPAQKSQKKKTKRVSQSSKRKTPTKKRKTTARSKRKVAPKKRVRDSKGRYVAKDKKKGFWPWNR